jgi:hypothetical protein
MIVGTFVFMFSGLATAGLLSDNSGVGSAVISEL